MAIRSIEQILEKCSSQSIQFSEAVIQLELEETGIERDAVMWQMRLRLETMQSSVEKGLREPVTSVSGMSKGNGFKYWQYLNNGGTPIARKLARAAARATAVGEVNAGMGKIVACPTAGAAGIVPAVLITLAEEKNFSGHEMTLALFTAGGIGKVIASRASISGAAGGCQAETGAAAAMAAGAAVELWGGTPPQISHAVAICLSNMLGLICDPVGGLVEIPCIQRNAGGVAQALVAADMALAGLESLIPADEVIDAMLKVGQRMDVSFRETGLGGLAATPTGKSLAQKVWNKTDDL